jgi:hypothetical protein
MQLAANGLRHRPRGVAEWDSIPEAERSGTSSPRSTREGEAKPSGISSLAHRPRRGKHPAEGPHRCACTACKGSGASGRSVAERDSGGWTGVDNAHYSGEGQRRLGRRGQCSLCRKCLGIECRLCWAVFDLKTQLRFTLMSNKDESFSKHWFHPVEQNTNPNAIVSSSRSQQTY